MANTQQRVQTIDTVRIQNGKNQQSTSLITKTPSSDHIFPNEYHEWSKEAQTTKSDVITRTSRFRP